MKISYKQKPKGIIFDCDGVIIDSFDSNTLFYNKLRNAVGLPDMTTEQRMLIHQLTGTQAFNLVIPEALHKAAEQAYKSIDYVRDIVPLIPLNEGLHSLLHYCKENGILTGIHTNRIVGMKEILLTHKLDEFYSPVMTPADLPAKPDPIGSLTICKEWNIEVNEALFIGDSDNDKKTATAANIPFIAFKNPDLISENSAASFKEVQDWLESL